MNHLILYDELSKFQIKCDFNSLLDLFYFILSQICPNEPKLIRGEPTSKSNVTKGTSAAPGDLHVPNQPTCMHLIRQRTYLESTLLTCG